jgi:Undecaprenyl-phosphate glucose phosphotransferase
VSDFVARDGELVGRVRPRIGIPYDAVALLFAVADAIIIIIASVIGARGYQFAMTDSVGDVTSVVGLGLVGSLAYGMSARHLGLYQISALLQPRRDYLQIFVSVLFLVLMLSVVLFLLKAGDQFSRGSVVSSAVLVLAVLIAWRKFAKGRLRTALQNGVIRGRRAVLIGTNAELLNLSSDKLLLQFGVDEATRVVLPHRNLNQPASAIELAAVETAIIAAREVDTEEVLICVSWDNASQLQLLREHLRMLPLPVRLLPDRFVRSIWDLQKSNDQSPLLIEIQREPLSRLEQIAKRSFDVAVAGFSLLVLSPIMLLTAIAVKLESPGPVIFRQRRKGFNGREFQIYKFRTMQVVEDGPVICQAKKHDERVTALGRILRRTSIDELPQLFNVLEAEMSIIGPRPHAVAHDDEYGNLIGHYAFRHHVKPGITGWAQVNGFRGGTPVLEQMEQRVELDLWYINNWSLGLDLQILARTSFELMRGHNAY